MVKLRSDKIMGEKKKKGIIFLLRIKFQILNDRKKPIKECLLNNSEIRSPFLSVLLYKIMIIINVTE